MNTISKHFFLEVLVKKLHSTVDKFATISKDGESILYTTKQQPKVKQVISLAEGKRIFEDLYGDIAIRWETTPEFAALASRKAQSQSRRANRKGSK